MPPKGPLVLVLIISSILLTSSSVIRGHPLGGDGLSLSLSDYGEKPQKVESNAPTKTMQRIMNDDVKEDFTLTESMINYMTTTLEQFANAEQVINNNNNGEHPISEWLMSKNSPSSSSPSSSSPALILNQNIAQELDFVFINFWSKFKPLVEKIVTERPAQLGPRDVDFRCKKTQEFAMLKEFKERSSLLSMFVDTFFSELYTHCLLRKLALIVIDQVNPSPVVKQFVDVYLEMPMIVANNEQSRQQMNNILVTKALNFNLPIAHSRIGPLQAAAELTFDSRGGLSMQTNKDQLVNQFRQECGQLGERLNQIWAEMDSFAHYLSSRMNDLTAFSERVKLASPQLIYGVICGQLSSQL